MDVEYYLKLVTSEYVDGLWGPQPFYEFSRHENVVARDPNVPKIEFKYEFDPISIRHRKIGRSLPELIVSRTKKGQCCIRLHWSWL